MKTRSALAVAALLCGAFGLASADTAHAADSLGTASWILFSPKGGADMTMASGHVLHVTVHHPTPQYYQMQFAHDVTTAVPAGKALHYQFWARSATKNPIHVVIEKRVAPYTHLLDKPIVLTPAWEQYAFIAPVPTPYGPGGLAARLQLGQQAGVIEFKAITVTQ